MPKVSVIIPTYNIEKHIRQCLDSVLNQTVKDIEVICVDDGSTDSTPKILKEYECADNRLKVYCQKNSGPGAARNTGLDKACGEYVIFLDSDDWFETTLLEKLLAAAKKHNADVAICRCVEFDTYTGREYPSGWTLKTEYLKSVSFSPQEIPEYFFQFTYGMPWDKLYLRSRLVGSGVRFPILRNSEDLAFVFPSLLSAERICICDAVLIHHRVNRKESVSNSRVKQPNDPFTAFEIVRRYLHDNGIYEQYEQSFLNWAMEFLVWHISNMNVPAVQHQYLLKFKGKWIKELGFNKRPAKYYSDRAVYIKYLLAVYLPFPLFRSMVMMYKLSKKTVGGRV